MRRFPLRLPSSLRRPGGAAAPQYQGFQPVPHQADGARGLGAGEGRPGQGELFQGQAETWRVGRENRRREAGGSVVLWGYITRGNHVCSKIIRLMYPAWARHSLAAPSLVAAAASLTGRSRRREPPEPYSQGGNTM